MKTLIYSILFMTVLLPSCVDNEELPFTPELVVEGWIENDGFPVVLLGQTLPISDSNQDINDYTVKWAKVTISDGDTTIILTGGHDANYLPPYKYTTYNMTGRIGKTYTITAEYQNMRATATTTIPEPAKIDSLQVIRCEDDTSYYIKAYFQDVTIEQPDYYILFSKRQKDKVYLFPSMGAISDEYTDRQITADIFRGTDYYSQIKREDTQYFKQGDVVQIKISHADEATYRFWKSYSNYKELSSNMFFPYSQNMVSNIIGGKGYWCGYGTTKRSVTIK